MVILPRVNIDNALSAISVGIARQGSDGLIPHFTRIGRRASRGTAAAAAGPAALTLPPGCPYNPPLSERSEGMPSVLAVRSRASRRWPRRLAVLAAVWLAAAAASGQGNGRKVILIDPGHGGDDNGARSAAGAFEKDVNLLLANALKSELAQDGHLQVALTREGDQRVPLEDRAVMANRLRADVFISLHCAHSLQPAVDGFLLYYFQPDAEQAETYHFLKAPVGSRELRILPWNLAQFRWAPASKELAGILQRRLNDLFTRSSGAPLGGPLKLLATVDCPAALLEAGHLSNAGDEQRLADPNARAAYAQALRQAVADFLKASEPLRHAEGP
jgi:N-acetylmuramoyl-L-alanine amidase